MPGERKATVYMDQDTYLWLKEYAWVTRTRMTAVIMGAITAMRQRDSVPKREHENSGKPQHPVLNSGHSGSIMPRIPKEALRSELRALLLETLRDQEGNQNREVEGNPDAPTSPQEARRHLDEATARVERTARQYQEGHGSRRKTA